MSKQNHEEAIQAAYVRSLIYAGIPENEAKKTADSAQYRNQFKRAEIDAYRVETGHVGTIPLEDLAEYVAGKYIPGCTVTEHGEIEERPLVYTLADFKAEADGCHNEHHLMNWAAKHSKRIKRHLTEEEVDEFRAYVDGLIAAFRGDPPIPDEPPDIPSGDTSGGDESPTDWQLAVEFDALCTEWQVKQLAAAVSEVLRASPFVVDGSCKLVTR